MDAQRDDILGLDAQRADVKRFMHGQQLLAEYTEIESGKAHTNRPKLSAAIAKCRDLKATLVIAKLDRLARNVAFIANLMESKVPFVALDLPDANEFTIHIFAAVAQNERKTISARVKAALAVKKRRGESGEQIGTDRFGNALYKLGNPRLAEAREIARRTVREKHTAVSPSTRMLIQELRRQGKGLNEIADTLNAQGIVAAKGGKWWGSAVRKQLAHPAHSKLS